MMRTGRAGAIAAVLVFLGSSVPGQEPADSVLYKSKIRPILVRRCFSCHSERIVKPKGDLRLDDLSTDFSGAAARETWRTVSERVASGEMPPKSKPRLSKSEVKSLTEWIRGSVSAAEAARRAAQGRVVYRRLNRLEYENSIRDLLSIEVDLQDLLPEDSSAHGFDNVGGALHVSSFLMDKYLEAADIALGKAIANRAQPPLLKKRYHLKDERNVKRATERVYLPAEDGVTLFSSSHWNAITMVQFYPRDRGRYRFRISASGVQSSGKPVAYRIDAGPMLMGTKNHLVSFFDAQADRPAIVEFVDRFEARSTIRILPYGLARAQTVNKIGAENYKGPGLKIHWVEVEGPLHDQWPPAGHRGIFGDLEQISVSRRRIEVASDHPLRDAERILRAFACRAFRRKVTKDEIKPYVGLVKAELDRKESFEQAVRVGLSGILVSPDFLFLREKPGTLDDFALASRLSYFLWSTMPDEELLAVAEKGTLRKGDSLRRQVERMLGHPKAATFAKNFVDQWLGLRDIDFTRPSHLLYPEFDNMLKESMVRETRLFFSELLKDDLSVANFVDSDFTILNGRLAKHYGIPGVDGWSFRKVMLPKDSHRGGVMTMASVLRVTANGTTTSPVMRGAWVLDRILGTPPPPPPGDVQGVEPDIRGTVTIREQLAKHREVPSCASCHSRIDPPGFALESFDVIGGWRDHYRTRGRGKRVILDGRRMPYLQGPKVECSDVLPDGRRFRDIDEYKRLLLTDKDQIARALIRRLVTYATGGAPEAVDQPEIEAILRVSKRKDYGLRTIIHEIIRSKLFQNK